MRGVQYVDEEVQVVLVGNFNPAIFNPQWFALKELMSEMEAEQASDVVCTTEFSKFVSDWHQLEVFPTRFVARTKHMGRTEELRDFVLNTFDILSETPIRSMGINKQIEYACPSMKAWHAVGDTLAPKTLWRDVLEVEDIGMKSIEVQAHRGDDLPGTRNIHVYPNLGENKHNVVFRVNAHFEIEKAIRDKKLVSMTQALQEHFEAEITKASSLSGNILEKVDEDGDFGRNN